MARDEFIAMVSHERFIRLEKKAGYFAVRHRDPWGGWLTFTADTIEEVLAGWKSVMEHKKKQPHGVWERPGEIGPGNMYPDPADFD